MILPVYVCLVSACVSTVHFHGSAVRVPTLLIEDWWFKSWNVFWGGGGGGGAASSVALLVVSIIVTFKITIIIAMIQPLKRFNKLPTVVAIES